MSPVDDGSTQLTPETEPANDRTHCRADELLVTSADDVRPVLSVIMPTKDEEEAIGECIDRIKTAVEELNVPTEIIVSDGSSDRTPAIAKENGATVVVPDRPGYGYAYRYAFEAARGDYLVIGDADMTYDFADIPNLVDRLVSTDADIVLGSRLNGDIERGAMPPLHRYVGNPLLTRFLNVFYGTDVSDAHSGFRVLSRDAVESLKLSTDGMEFASEMIMEAGARDLEIGEVPITYHPRVGEAKLESFRDGWRHVRFMLQNAPGYLFSVPGFVLVLLGAVLMTLVSAGTTTLGVRSMIAGGVLVIVGYQLFIYGHFSTIATDPIRRANGRVATWFSEQTSFKRGIAAGFVACAAGGTYALYAAGMWLASGYEGLPPVTSDIAAFVVIAVGVQTMFGSFLADMLREKYWGEEQEPRGVRQHRRTGQNRRL